jgi:hypothetical protein
MCEVPIGGHFLTGGGGRKSYSSRLGGSLLGRMWSTRFSGQSSNFHSSARVLDYKETDSCTSTNSIFFNLKRSLSLQRLLPKYARLKARKKVASVKSFSPSSLHTCNGSNFVAYGGLFRHMCSHLHFGLGKHCEGIDLMELGFVLNVGSVGVRRPEMRLRAPMKIF